MIKKRFDKPDETRTPSKTKVEVVQLGEKTALRSTFEPGWTWDECVKPVAGTDSCQTHHFTYIVSGKMKVKMNDGKEELFVPGDIAEIPPGHHAFVIGDEACVMIDFPANDNYAKGSRT